jgi:hypothetical protein
VKQIKTLSDYNKTTAAEHLKDLEIQRKKIVDMWKGGLISVTQYHKAVTAANRAIVVAQKEAATVFTKMWSGAASTTKSALSQMSQKIGLDLEHASLIGLAAWGLGLIDLQRRLSNWAGLTGEMFGMGGKKGGEAFRKGMLEYMPDRETFRFVTDQMRMEFGQTLYQLGANLGEFSGKSMPAQIGLIKFGQAFGIATGEMAQSYFTFSDILKKSGTGVSDYVNTIGAQALKWKLHPGLIVSMNARLLDQYKLMRMSGKELTDILGRLVSVTGVAKDGFSKMLTVDIAQKWVSAIESLDQSKIAGLIKLVAPEHMTRGMTMLSTLQRFYKEGRLEIKEEKTGKIVETMDREQLNIAGMLKLQKQLIDSQVKPEDRSGRLMQLIEGFYGLAPEVASPIAEAILKVSKGGEALSDKEIKGLAKKVDQILKETTPIGDQMLNVITNGLNLLVRGVWLIVGGLSKRWGGMVVPTKQDLEQKQLFELMSKQQMLYQSGRREEAKKMGDTITAIQKRNEESKKIAVATGGASLGGRPGGRPGVQHSTQRIKFGPNGEHTLNVATVATIEESPNEKMKNATVQTVSPTNKVYL